MGKYGPKIRVSSGVSRISVGSDLMNCRRIVEFYLGSKCQSDGKHGENGKARHFEKIMVITIEIEVNKANSATDFGNLVRSCFGDFSKFLGLEVQSSTL